MLSLSCLPLTAGAAVVLYTTQDDALPQTDIPFEVVYLDAPERLLDEALLQPGTELSEADAPHITALLQSPAWQARETALRQAYQGVVQAWQLGCHLCRRSSLMRSGWFTAPPILHRR